MTNTTSCANMHGSCPFPPLPMVRTQQSDVMPVEEMSFLDAYEQYSDAIYRHCHYRVFDRERARDLMQEVFVRAWEYAQRGGEIRNMRAFLYRIANNLIIDESRKKREASLEHMQENGFDPGQENVASLHARIDCSPVLQALCRLDDQYRTILVMRYVQDLTPREIARLTGESSNTISVRIYRGLRQMRSQLTFQSA